MEYILVGIGGMLGSITRFGIGKILTRKLNTFLPLGTMLINITGALFLGLLLASYTSKNIYFLLGDGFLGAYTTFSTFMYEGFNLLKNRHILNALIYIFSSIVLGLIGFALGIKIGHQI